MISAEFDVSYGSSVQFTCCEWGFGVSWDRNLWVAKRTKHYWAFVLHIVSPVKSREAPRRAMIAGRTGSRALCTVNRAYESIKAIRSMTDQHWLIAHDRRLAAVAPTAAVPSLGHLLGWERCQKLEKEVHPGPWRKEISSGALRGPGVGRSWNHPHLLPWPPVGFAQIQCEFFGNPVTHVQSVIG